MDKNLKELKAACCISAVGVVISMFDLIASAAGDADMETSIIVFCCVIVLLCACIVLHQIQKRKIANAAADKPKEAEVKEEETAAK